MSQETKTCLTCKKQFTIRPEDFKFYERLDAPLPEYCPPCRMQRRLAHRNERTLYKRTCDLCKKETISIYPSKAPWPVYCQKCWWSDKWDPKEYAMIYNPQKPFFEQFKELQSRVPRIALLVINSVNSDYTNNTEDNKNCYLMFAAGQDEDCSYGRLVYHSKSVMDATFVHNSEFCYECIDCRQCYNSMFSEQCHSSMNLLFCFNARDSQNCIFCANIRHKSYCIENRSVSKEEFERRKKEILASYTSIQKAKKYFEQIKSRTLVKYAFQVKCHNAVGNYLFNCHDVYLSYDAVDVKSSSYVADVEKPIDCYDLNNAYAQPELCLDLMGIIKCYRTKHSTYVFFCNEVEYCDGLDSCQYCFGSINLKKAKYCILNKEYTKEEYFKLKTQIVASMKKEGVYGQFFPPSLSPFGYNETLAKDFFPLSKNEAQVKGFSWQDNQTGTFGKETISKEEMPSTVEEVEDEILNEILVCEDCGRNFRLIKSELDFYRKMHLPLPRKDFECRHQARMSKRNPRKLWHRQCQCAGKKSENGIYENTIEHFHSQNPCPNEFETAYAPERQEIIYCEQCYLAEVV